MQLQMTVLTSNNFRELAARLFNMPELRQEFMRLISEQSSKSVMTMKKRKHGDVSKLMLKNYDDLLAANMLEIVIEFGRKFPDLIQIILSVMIPREKWMDADVFDKAIPRLAMVYGILLQYNFNELSLMQRLVSICLADCICEQKIYDRLNKVGVSLSYGRMLALQKHISGHFNQQIVDAVVSGRTFRLIGDNLNFSVGVHDEKQNNHKHMVHMFASAAIIIDKTFTNMKNSPEIDIDNLTLSDIVLSIDEYAVIRDHVKRIVFDTASTHLPQLCPLLEHLDREDDKLPDSLCHENKTSVVPLPVLQYNEQKYADVVKILESYENTVNSASERKNIQIGGDQLTRERFSGAKRLRIGNEPPNDFGNLTPVTFEFFHLAMNFLEKAIIKNMYKDTNSNDIGTMKCEIERLIKHEFDTDVIKAYEADKAVVISITKAYIAEALMECFGLESKADTPAMTNHPTVADFIDNYIFPIWSGKEDELDQSTNVNQETVNFDDIRRGKRSTARFCKKLCTPNVRIRCYFHCIANVLKCPSRTKLLSTFKVMMLILWGKNTKAKYPLEIYRLLVQQYCLLSQQEAFQSLSTSFVNTKGKPDSHIPADLQMEWVVKEQKKHIKHMYNNKTSGNIYTRSSCLPGVTLIANKFDNASGVVVRATKHKRKSMFEDECKVLEDLRTLRPFKNKANRRFKDFPNIAKSAVMSVDWLKFGAWFERHKNKFEQ